MKHYLTTLFTVLAGCATVKAQQARPLMRADSVRLVKLETMMRDYGNLQKYAAMNLQLHKNRQGKLIILMGDSITEQWLKLDPTFFETHPLLVNRGISGQTGRQMLLRFRQDVIDLKPDRVVILCGTNDIAGNTGIEDEDEILGHIKSMAELAAAHRMKVVLCSILPAIGFRWQPDLKPAAQILNLNSRIKHFAAERKLQYIDYHTAMRNNENGLKSELTKDGVHPNLSGYKIMEPLLLKALK